MSTERLRVAAANQDSETIMELGLYSFAEVIPDPVTGWQISPAERLAEILDEITLADQVGLDVFGLGEHHRKDFASSSPATVLAAASAKTRNIRLSSAVTVLSSADPVRVFQEFATLDLLSGGRAEIMAGRGAFTESFPLFGFPLEDYDELFDEKLGLLLALRKDERVTWQGRHRAALRDQGVYPRPVQPELPVWVGVGGTPSSPVRAGTFGLPMSLGIIGGDTRRFAPLADIYRQAGTAAGHDPAALRVGISSHGYVAESTERAVDETYPYFLAGMQAFLGHRAGALPSRAQYEAELVIHGALVAGTPEQVAEKIVFQHRIFGHDRFLLQNSVGTMAHENVLRSIELFGTKVAPLVREALGEY
ncbi:MAG TPA: LLM class flavin-dependent oxidoreductase [Trebonia sp.]